MKTFSYPRPRALPYVLAALFAAAAAGASGRPPRVSPKKPAVRPANSIPPLLSLLPTRDVDLQPGETVILEFMGMTQVSIGDPLVADVAPVSKRELLLMGKGIGETS